MKDPMDQNHIVLAAKIIFIKVANSFALNIKGTDNKQVASRNEIDLFVRDCKTKGTQTASCDYNQYYNTTNSKCETCDSKFPNCAACNNNTCLICQQYFYWNPDTINPINGVKSGMCKFDACPIGFCMDQLKRTCVTSTINNCLRCNQDINAKQQCSLCKSGYLPIIDPNNKSSCKQLIDDEKTINYYVKGGAPLLQSQYTYDHTINDGTTPKKAFLFIQEAINALQAYQLKGYYQKVTSTIYLGNNNNHFFFQCDGDESFIFYTDANYIGYMDYCSQLNLKKSVLLNDNIHFTIKPLYCSYAKDLGMANNADFLSMCISNQNLIFRPKIYVNHKNAYFNISGSATFENIVFSGINAFAQPLKKTQDFSIFPFLMCDVQYTAQIGDRPLTLLSQNQNASSTLYYSCQDIWYSKSRIPKDLTTNARCAENNKDQFYSKQQSTFACSNDIDSPDFFWQNPGDQIYSKRRQTLFNLYAFPDHLTTYQNPPTLNIKNCDFEYFLGGYSNLINIEYNNIIRITKQRYYTVNSEAKLIDMHFFAYSSQQRGARIYIENSNFRHSRFCLGLITYRPELKITQFRSFINYTNHFQTNLTYRDDGSYIILKNSTFNNLNFLTNVTALAIYDGETPTKLLQGSNSLEQLTYKSFIHKGIVLNLENFNGTVEIDQCKFTNNMHFIPEALVMPNSISLVKDPDHFRDIYFTNEYKISICNPETKKDEYLFHHGISKDDNLFSYFDKFERLGLIYVSRSSQPLIITNSYFESNMGTFGGAITVNSPNWIQGYKPYIYIFNNQFIGNLAYFSGNALYINNRYLKSHQQHICAGVHMDSNYFYQNIGMKNHNGGAVGGICFYLSASNHDDYHFTSSITTNLTRNDTQNNITANITSAINPEKLYKVFAFQFSILNCIFRENYSGQRGTALYINQVSKLRIGNTTFDRNGPVYGYTEIYVSPYSKYFSNRPLSFVDLNENGCVEEFGYINYCGNVDEQLDWPSIRGAVHVVGCIETWCLNVNNTQLLFMYNSSFINNQAGPYLDINTRNDLASSLYLSGGLNNTIINTTFVNHSGTEMRFIKYLAPSLTNYFPDIYFDYAQAPIVRIRVQPKTIVSNKTLNFSTVCDNCTFQGNKHIQILGLNFEKQYYGSLITMESFYLSGDLYAPQLILKNSLIKDNQFKGNETSLIYLFKGLLSVINTTAYGNGYLTREVVYKSRRITDNYFPYESYKFQKFSKYGVFQLIGAESFPMGYYHQFINNTFSYNFAYQGAVYSLRIDGQYALFERNKYRFNFANYEGGIAFARNQDGRSTFIFKEEDAAYIFGQSHGAYALEPHDADFLSVFFYNSTFKNNKAIDGSSLYLDSLAAFEARNLTFFQDAWHSNTTAFIVSQFKKGILDIREFIDYQYLQYLADEQTPQSGQVFAKKQANSQNVYFLDKLMKNASDPYSSYAEFIDCRFFNLSSNHGAAIMAEEEQNVRVIATKYDPKTVITNNTVTEFGVFYAYIATNFIAENLVFNNNLALVRGSAIGASSTTETKVEVINCTFINNRAISKATIYINENTDFICDKCIFESNYAREASAIFALNVLSNSILVQNSIFKNNRHESHLINFILSQGTFKNTWFIDNYAAKVNHGITLINSKVLVSNVTVNYTLPQFLRENDYQVDAGFFSLNFRSNLTIKNQSLFQNCRGAQGSVIYATGYSSVILDGNSTIQDCASIQGSSLYFTMTNQVKIDNMNFINNTQHDIILVNADAQVNNSTFSRGTQQFIKAQEANLIVYNSTFQDGPNSDTNGKGIYCSCQNLTIVNSTFRNLTGLEGGALWLSSTYSKSYFLIANSTFIQNKAMHGGAIKVQDAANLDFIGNQFTLNRAERVTFTTAKSQNLVDKGLGGAINLDCFNEAAKLINLCNINFKNGNIFKQNYAENDGGAIIWTANRFQYDQSTIFIDNQANYGNNIGSYAKSLMIQFINNNDPIFPIVNNSQFYRANQTIKQEEPQFTIRRLLQQLKHGNQEKLFKFDIEQIPRKLQNYHQSKSLNFDGIVSGLGFSFIIYILDQDDNLYTSDSSSIAILKSQTQDVIVQNFEANAKKGVYNFPQVIVKLEPGKSAKLILDIQGMTTYANSVDFIINPFTINIQSRPCQIGEEFTNDKSCVVCRQGKYLYDAPQSEKSCQKCDPNALCFGLSKVAPKPGYWRSSNISTNFIKCPNSFACQGGNEYSPLGNCSYGFRGVICGNCISGFKKTADFKCSVCPDQAANAAQFIGLIIVAIIVCSFLVRSNINSANKEKPIYTVYMKIMTNHFQMVSAISAIDFSWPSEIEELQEGQSSISSFADNIFSFDCFLQQSGNNEENNQVYLQKLIVFALLPLILALCSVTFWVIVGLIKRNIHQIKDKLISTMVVLLFLVHPTIAKVLFQAFNCIEVDGVNRLKSNIDMICYQDKHLIYLVVVVIPAIVVWVIGIPLASLVMLLKNRNQIVRVGKHEELSQSERYKILHLKMKYGFLFNGYNLETFFWEVIILYRKISIVMVSVFFSVVSTEAQVLVVILIIVLSLLLQIRYKPFYTDVLNTMELYSLQVAVITMYGGMFFVTGRHYQYMGSNGLRWFFLLFILAPNILFFLYWLHYMRIEVLKIIYQKNAKLFKILSCNLYKGDSFQEQYMSNQEESIKGQGNNQKEDLSKPHTGQSQDETYYRNEKTYQIDHDKTDFSNIDLITKYDEKEYDHSKYLPKQTSTSEYDIQEFNSNKRKYSGKNQPHKNNSKLNRTNSIDSNEQQQDPIKLGDLKLDFPLHMMKKIPETFNRGDTHILNNESPFGEISEFMDDIYINNMSNRHQQPQSQTKKDSSIRVNSNNHHKEQRKVQKLMFPVNMFEKGLGGLTSNRDGKSSRRVMPETLANKISARKSSRFMNDIIQDENEFDYQSSKSNKDKFQEKDISENTQKNINVKNKPDQIKIKHHKQELIANNFQHTQDSQLADMSIDETVIHEKDDKPSPIKKVIDFDLYSENNVYPVFQHQDSATKMLDNDNELINDFAALQSDAGIQNIGKSGLQVNTILTPVNPKASKRENSKQKKSGRLWRIASDFDSVQDQQERLNTSIKLPSIVDKQQNLSDMESNFTSQPYGYDIFGNPQLPIKNKNQGISQRNDDQKIDTQQPSKQNQDEELNAINKKGKKIIERIYVSLNGTFVITSFAEPTKQQQCYKQKGFCDFWSDQFKYQQY